MADGGQGELFAVVSACGEHRAQFRCLGLTGTDIHIYIHTYTQTGNDYASRLLALPFGLAITHDLGTRLDCTMSNNQVDDHSETNDEQ